MFFDVNATEARKSVFYATGFIGYFYILTIIIGFGAIVLLTANPEFADAAAVGGIKVGRIWRRCNCLPRWAVNFCSASFLLSLSPPF